MGASHLAYGTLIRSTPCARPTGLSLLAHTRTRNSACTSPGRCRQPLAGLSDVTTHHSKTYSPLPTAPYPQPSTHTTLPPHARTLCSLPSLGDVTTLVGLLLQPFIKAFTFKQ